MSALHPTLLRQLRRFGLQEDTPPSDPDTWARLLQQIDGHYVHMESDRDMLNHSLEVSTEEMLDRQESARREQEQLTGLLQAVVDALEVFQGALRAPEDAALDRWSDTTAISQAQRNLSLTIASVLSELDGTTTGDTAPVRALRAGFSTFSERLIDLLSQASRHAALLQTVEDARAVQLRLLPSEEPDVQTLGLRVAGWSEATDRCGGDWWYTRALSPSRALAIIGDVTGHGAGAALLAAAARGATTALCEAQGEHLRLGTLMDHLNRLTCEGGGRALMMSCCALLIDQERRELRIVNAGHPFPLLVRQGKVHTILGVNSPFGVDPEHAYAVGRAPFERGDAIILYTDGITEAENPLGEAFGEKRLRRTIAEHGFDSPAAVRDHLLQSLRRFAGEHLSDDATCVVLLSAE